MKTDQRNRLRETIVEREQLRPLKRLPRLLRDPFHVFPYYVLAALSHVRPFRMRFTTLWNTHMTSYLPEGNTFYFYGYCEANLTNFFLRYVREGTICVDIGAHIGFYSMLFSELTGPAGRVHSFEPTPWTYRLLEENTSSLPNVTRNNMAVSHLAQSLSFADYGPGYGAYNTAHADGASTLHKKPHMTTVPSISLDTYCTEHEITPDIIKIDAEGFEYDILLGMTTLFKNTSVTRPVVTLEVAGGDEWKDNRENSFALLSEHSYIPCEIHVDGKLSRHIPQAHYTYDNLVFVPQERLGDIKNLLD